MAREWDAENDAERMRLRALVAGLTDEELRRPMPAGWTVAAVLAHIAFWDARALYFLDRWLGGTEPSSDDYKPEDVARANDTVKPLCLALAPPDSAALVLRLAEEADGKVARLSDDLLMKVAAAGRASPPYLQDRNGSPFNLARATHRREHLDDIERVLATHASDRATRGTAEGVDNRLSDG
jgi:hypothetical protein